MNNRLPPALRKGHGVPSISSACCNSADVGEANKWENKRGLLVGQQRNSKRAIRHNNRFAWPSGRKTTLRRVRAGRMKMREITDRNNTAPGEHQPSAWAGRFPRVSADTWAGVKSSLRDGSCPCVASRREQVLWNSNSIDRQRATERTERHRSHLSQPPWNISASSIRPPLALAFCLQIRITARWRWYQLQQSITNALFRFSAEHRLTRHRSEARAKLPRGARVSSPAVTAKRLRCSWQVHLYQAVCNWLIFLIIVITDGFLAFMTWPPPRCGSNGFRDYCNRSVLLTPGNWESHACLSLWIMNSNGTRTSGSDV